MKSGIIFFNLKDFHAFNSSVRYSCEAVLPLLRSSHAFMLIGLCPRFSVFEIKIGKALDRGNYKGLKLIEQVMKVLERVLDSATCQMVDIVKTQYDLVPDSRTTYAIFTVGQLQEK